MVRGLVFELAGLPGGWTHLLEADSPLHFQSPACLRDPSQARGGGAEEQAAWRLSSFKASSGTLPPRRGNEGPA